MISQVLRALESLGLVLCLAHPTDTQVGMPKQTQAGKKLAIGAVPDVEEVGRNFFSVIANQRNSFNRVLQSLISKG